MAEINTVTPSGEPPDPDEPLEPATALTTTPAPLPDFERVVRYPYSARSYVARAAWMLAYVTIWKLAVRPARPLILRLFGARTASKINLAGSAWVEMPWLLECGEYVSVGPRVILYNLGGLSIGDRSVISQDAYLCGGTHDYTDPTYPLLRKRITIGSGVWIAAGAFVGPGVTVGDGAVVGARAVVMRDVEPWTVVAGNPARIIKRRELKYGRAQPSRGSARGL